MYDWANSAYGTTVLAGLLGPYLSGAFPGSESYYLLIASISAALIFLAAPVLGAIADFSGAKKRFLLFFAYTGSLTTLLFFFADSLLFALGIFLITQTAFVAANVFYDAFLPSIASERDMDRISGRGYAYGYVGGGLQFLLALLLVSFSEELGIERGTAVRTGMAMSGLWWAGFTLFTLVCLREPSRDTLPPGADQLPRVVAFVKLGLARTLETTRKVRRFRHLLLFLIAFLFYNDGIQTAILVTTTYGSAELRLPEETLMITLLLIQFVGVGGAIVFSRLAGRIGARHAIMLSLVGWSGLVFYAISLREGNATGFFVMGCLAGLVLGGSQALSRSLFGSMIPVEASAEFYGFYSVFAKFSAIWGPLTLAAADIWFGSLRYAIPFLLIFFIVGLVLLWFVDEEKAREASARGAF
jgi:MFS transporter, UMF1 family